MDVSEIDEQIKKLTAEDIGLQSKLGEAISKNEPESILKNYEEQIMDLRVKKNVLNTQKNLLLEFSFENAVLNYVSQVITYLSLEVLDGKDWKRMFNSIEDFQKFPDEGLINTSATFSMVLQYS
jgi:hypothetical protein